MEAAVSVPANIAEGFKRHGQGDKARVLNIAEASLEELRYYFILTKDLNYTSNPGDAELAEEVARMLAAYCQTIRSKS